jgi:hypothetical protein
VIPDEIEYPEVSVGELYAATDELGKAKFDAALNLVRARKAMARVRELEQQKTSREG